MFIKSKKFQAILQKVKKAGPIKSYKTTISGIVAATAGFIAYSPDTFGGKDQVIVRLAGYIAYGGLVSLGINSTDVKDSKEQHRTSKLTWTIKKNQSSLRRK